MDAKPLRVGYVPESFACPLLQLAEMDNSIELVALPSGTGQHIAAFDAGDIDVSIALTEALIAGIAKGKTSYKLVGQYVSSPLNWGIIVGHDSPHQTVADLRGGTIGISRIGSGSQVMASVLALQEGWFSDATAKIVEPLKFEVRDTFKGLRDGVNGSDAFFMWEVYTTKPFVDSEEVRFVGSIHTPWPAWTIAAAPSVDSVRLKSFLERLTCSVTNFESPRARQQDDVTYILKHFDYKEEDVRAWLQTVHYPEDCGQLPTTIVTDTLSILETAGVVKRPSGGWQLESFVRAGIANAS